MFKAIQKPELLKLLDQLSPDFFLLDVRDQDEYEAGHIPTAILAPWENITEKVSGIPKNKHLILYCRTGIRAQKAGKMLEQAGYNNILVYVPGWIEWEN